MLQSLDVISVNLWLTLISLANLVILFLIIKRFLFKPVQNIMDKRQKEIGEQYEKAEAAENEADKNKAEWAEKLKGAKEEANLIVSSASETAKIHSEKIVSEAKETAQRIIKSAETDAALEYQKALDNMKKEIVEVSKTLTEKMLSRKINEDDHRTLIDSFIKEIGENDD